MSSFDAITDFKDLPADWSFVRSDWGHMVLRDQVEPRTIDTERVFHYSIPSIQATGTGAEENPEEIASSKFLLRGNELLVSKLNPRKGCVLLAEQQELPTICSTEFVVMKPDASIFNAQFSYYLYASHPVRAYISGLVQSATRSHQRANPDHISKVWLPKPPIETQRRIAAFLDRKTAAIDALIAKKQRLITLLQEKRQALITHAVTKGLNPNAPMKDSGIPWIGDIPAHWDRIKTKWLKRRIQTGSTPPTTEAGYYAEGTIPWYGPGSFTTSIALSEPSKRLNVDAITDGVARMFPPETTLVVGIGATIGKSAYLDHAASSNQQVTGIVFDQGRMHPKFGFLVWRMLEGVIKTLAPQTTLPIFNQSQMGDMEMPTPPLDEQCAIANHVWGGFNAINKQLIPITTSVTRLSEYRQALISAAVTGQLSIPEEAA